MRCFDARKKLSALLDSQGGAGEGDAAARDAVAAHVDGCPACRAELEMLAGVDRALELTLGRAEAPAGYHDGLWARLEARLEGEGSELADVRALATRAIARASSAQASVVSDLLQAPAVLGQVVLPSPAAPPRRGRRMALVAGGLVAATAAVLFAVMRPDRSSAPAATPAATVTPTPTLTPVTPAVTPTPAPAAAPPAEPPPEERPKRAPVATAPREPKATPPATPAVTAPAKPTKPEKSAAEILQELSAPTTPAPEAPKPGGVGIEKLSHDQIKAGMAQVEGNVQSCRPPAEARVVVVLRLRVNADGSVAEAQPIGAASPAGSCVAEKARAARFATFDGPPMTIKYSFTLEADE